MKHIHLILSLFFISTLHAQKPPQIKLLATELHTNFYKEKTYSKKMFKDYVISDSLFSEQPDTIRSFELDPDEDLKLFYKTCDLKARNIDGDYKKANTSKSIKAFWQDKLKICYAKYIQTAPEIRFVFELQNNTNIYHINTVSVYIYHARTPLSTEKNYFAHKEDEREKLIIDITKTNKEQVISLKQAHAVKEGGLALNLRLFPSEFWDGSFDRTKVLLHISFKFTNGQEIQSEPFMVEI